MHKTVEDIGKLTLQGGRYREQTIESIFLKDIGYLEWLKEKEYPYACAVKCYLDKIQKTQASPNGGPVETKE